MKAIRIGWKITDERDRSILLAYQQCVDQNADRFIIEDTVSPQQLEAALHLLLSDVCERSLYRIRRSIRSGYRMMFEDTTRVRFVIAVGEWIGNRSHGVVFVDAVRQVREKYRLASY